jgi:hypothetical protein
MKKIENITVVSFWKEEVKDMTLSEAVVVLRHLGGFEFDKVSAHTKVHGYRRLAVCDLLDWYPENALCREIHPVLFRGGPTLVASHSGTLMTVVLDRVILIALEKGADFVLKVIRYARTFRFRASAVRQKPRACVGVSGSTHAR